MVAQTPDLDPARLDLVTPEYFERNGYPHAEWTRLRENATVFWYQRPNVDPFRAIKKHADIVEIGKRSRDFLGKDKQAAFWPGSGSHVNRLRVRPAAGSASAATTTRVTYCEIDRISVLAHTPRASRSKYFIGRARRTRGEWPGMGSFTGPRRQAR